MDSQFSSMAISESQNTPFRSHFRLRKASQTLRFRFRFRILDHPYSAFISVYTTISGGIGDMKGSASGGDRSSKRDIVGAQIDPNALVAHQQSFTQGMNYLNSEV
ncbi:hypothetical protein LOK49_LG03G00258 [Camellia lanceoleosa]|uniref:Uncharacterized protein n=1 Tax=Camellia lanceoleosa TaxID=1840588 RepID=A0ACC0IAN9_9ERIC|nr:hypothetical protein LOK49_LG03G00258 [Camellia lanceoleosa]